MPSLEISLVGGKLRNVARRAYEFQPQCSRDGLGDLILDREHVRHFPVIALRPEMRSVFGIDELCRNSYAATSPTHAAFQNSTHPERFSDLADVLLFSSERKRRGPSDHLQAGNVRERVDDLFCQTVAEVFILFIRAHVG